MYKIKITGKDGEELFFDGFVVGISGNVLGVICSQYRYANQISISSIDETLSKVKNRLKDATVEILSPEEDVFRNLRGY